MGLMPVEYRALGKRRVSEKTCRLFGYGYGEITFPYQHHPAGTSVQIADYRDASGNVVAQHVRFADKTFFWAGEEKDTQLFGQHLWEGGSARMVVVTEGEIDALSVAEVQDCKWPVVSIGCGAAEEKFTAKITRYIARHSDFLNRFETVVFMFDNDAQGKASAKAAAAALPTGKAKIATLPLKDASEMLQAGRGDEIVSAIWGARPYRPDGIVSVADVAERARNPLEAGRDWAWPSLTALTYGRRPRELYAFGAGVGIGKTDVFVQQMAFDLDNYPEPIGVLMLEQPVEETVRRVLGKRKQKLFHIPGENWSEEEYRETLDGMVEENRLWLYDHSGRKDWDTIASTIRYFVQAQGCRHIYLDHLTALTSASQDERRELDRLMAEMAGLAHELDCVIHFVSHLSTPEGKAHEEGGRVLEKHFTGSRAIARWSHFMFGLERNKQAEDLTERCTTILRVLKDRMTGRAAGEIVPLFYERHTGMLIEREFDACPFSAVPSDSPF